MKKILFTLLILSFAGSAFAAPGALATHIPSDAAASIRGGATQILATAAATPLIKTSTGVSAMVNFIDGTPTGTSTDYTIFTRHTSGSKNFGTTNSKTNIYWKQAAKVDAVTTVSAAMLADIPGQIGALFSFGGTGGWTSY